MNGVLIKPRNARPSDYLKDIIDYERLQYMSRKAKVSELDLYLWMAKEPQGIGGASGTLSNYAETSMLNHLNIRTTFAIPAALALALTTVTPDSSKTGATITEAIYTGYARAALTNTTMAAAISGGAGAASTAASASAITYANCTAGSSTIIGWALLDSVTTGAGNMLWWGSATSTVISTTQTPATIASGGLTQSLL